MKSSHICDGLAVRVEETELNCLFVCKYAICTYNSVCRRSLLTHNNTTELENYRLDLSSVRLGSRVGITHCADGTLHYYLDGIDQGPACSNVPPGWLF